MSITNLSATEVFLMVNLLYWSACIYPTLDSETALVQPCRLYTIQAAYAMLHISEDTHLTNI